MYKRKLFLISFFSIASVSLFIFYLQQLRWVTYKDSAKDFSIDHPVTWTHEYDSMRDFADRWFVERPREGAGKFSGDQLILEIYESPKNRFSDLQNSVRQSKNAVKTDINIAGVRVNSFEYPSIFYVGPLEHEGKFYYFLGTNNSITKKVLSTFLFIN